MNQLRIDEPVEGYYRLRLVRGGPWVPARIFRASASDPETGEPLDRPALLQGEIGGNGKYVDPFDLWPRVAGNGITQAEYEYMTADREWARQWNPSDPVANPTEAVDLRKMSPIGPPGVRK